MHLRARMALPAVAVLAPALFLGAMAWALAIQGRTEDARRLVGRTYEVIERQNGLLTALIDAETGQRGFLLTGEEAYLEPYTAALPRIEHELAQGLAGLTTNAAGEVARLAELRRLVEARLATLRETIELRRAGEAAAATAAVRQGRGKELMDAARALVAGLQADERAALNGQLARLDQRAAAATNALVLAGLLALALGGTTGAVLLREARAGRRRAERALSEEEAHARAILDLSPQVLWTAGSDGAIDDFAERWLEWTGLTREAALGAGWQQVPHPHDLPAVAAAWRHAVATGEPLDVEHRIRMADGSFRWMRSRAVPRRDPATGAIRRWYGTTEDVHDRRRAEDALRQSEARLRAVLEQMPVGVALAEIPSGRLTYHNRRAIEMIGHPLLETGDVSGYARYGAVHEDGRVYAPEEYPVARAVQRGEAVDGEEMRYRRGNGRVVWLAVSAAPVRAEGTALAVSTFTDITELRHIQEALRRALAEQRAVYANAPVGLSAHDRSLRFLAVNARLAAMNGFPVEAHIGRTLREAVPLVAPYVEPLLRQVLATGEPVPEVEIETETAAHPGRKRFYLASYYPVRAEEGGEVDGVSVAILDIDARKRAEASLRELAATLERRVEERTLALSDMVAQLDAFAYTVSHDLRAPLRAMDGFARILLEEHAEALGPRGQRHAKRIVDAAMRMDELIRDLLAYSRLSRADIELGRVDLEAVVEVVVRDLVAQAGPTPPEIAVQQPLPEVRANRAVLGQIVANLLANAVKFVTARERPRVRIRAEERPEGRVRLWVEDNGIGIAAEHQARIFNVFERLHGQESYPGTGIGLAIVRKGTERMGGKAGVESEGPGHGSRFWIELPAAGGGEGP